jgi:hypothetical protein
MGPIHLISDGPWSIELSTAEDILHFSKFLMNACLRAGQWLFVGVAALALLAVLADWFRGATDGRPGVMLVIAAGCLVLALLFFTVRRWLDNNYPPD